MSKKCIELFITFFTTVSLGACGMQTPDFTAPLQPKPTDELVGDIVGHVKSEVGCAMISLIDADKGYSQENNHPRNLVWLDNSVAKVTINLIVEEKSSLNPSISDTIPYQNAIFAFARGGNVTTGQSFSAAAGASIGADATRKITTDYTFSIGDDFIKNKDIYSKFSRTCKVYEGSLISGDLKIADSFNGMLSPQLRSVPAKGSFVSTGAPDTLQTEISFLVSGSGTVSPTWKLSPISYNPGSNALVSAGRSTTNDVIVTIGPNNQNTQTAHNIAKANAASATPVATSP